MKTSEFTIDNRQIKSKFEKKPSIFDTKSAVCTCEERKDYNEQLSSKLFVSQSSLKHELNFN